jgi:hypothetical protein
MNRVTLILTFLFSLMFSSPSYSEWTKVSEDGNGDTFYVDFETIRKVDGYIYWWSLRDYLKPDKWGDLSGKRYYQGDCKLFRTKFLSSSYQKEPMGGGTGDSYSPENPEWEYPVPNSPIGTILKSVCNHVYGGIWNRLFGELNFPRRFPHREFYIHKPSYHSQRTGKSHHPLV